MKLFPGDVLWLDFLLLLLGLGSGESACFWIITARKACAVLSALHLFHLLLCNLSEIFVETAFQDCVNNTSECNHNSKGEKNGGQMDVFLAKREVVIHSCRPVCALVQHRLNAVSERKLSVGVIGILQVFKIQRQVVSIIKRNVLAGSVASWLDFEAHDALLVRLGNVLELDCQDPVVVQDVALFTVEHDGFADGDTVVVDGVEGAVLRVALFDS